MKKLLVCAKLFLFLLLLCIGVSSKKHSISCKDKNAIQNLIDSDTVLSGDVIQLKKGKCEWSSGFSIPNDKKLTIEGKGKESTIISMDIVETTSISLSQSGSRVTGIRFNGGRISENDFMVGVSVRGNRDDKHPTGLVHHSQFHNTRVLVIGDAALLAHYLWYEPITLGSKDGVVYVEDCEFFANIHSNAVDTNYGGRYVFRYNSVTDTYIEAHSLQGTHRATRYWEIYGNKIFQKDRAMWVPAFLRGGTGVFFDNELIGTFTMSAVALDNVRSCDSRGAGKRCNGSSPWDGNRIGRGKDMWLWNSTHPYPPQEDSPVYCWNNKHGNKNVTFFQHGCSDSHDDIQPNRDYFNNVKKPNYIPLPYPHPDNTGEKKTGKNTLVIVLSISIGLGLCCCFGVVLIVVVLVMIFLGFFVWKRKEIERKSKNEENEELV